MQGSQLKRWGGYVLAAAMLLLLAPGAWARHIVGGEVTYRCLGDGSAGQRRYEVKVYLYRDCASGGALFDSAPGSSGAFEMTIFRGRVNIGTVEIPNGGLVIDKLPVDLSNPCIVFPPNICVQRGVYTTTISLPISTETYTISYQRCCRNETISNITAPGDAGATYLVEIPANAQQECNNTPTFENFPPLVICANTLLEFDGSANDVDGDSLVYELCEPVYGGGNITRDPGQNSFGGVMPNPESPPPYTPIVFTSGFTSNTPVDGLILLNSRTGLLSVRPLTVGQYVVCVSVREFRRGVLIGEVRRDFQFNIVNCDPRVTASVTAIVGADSVSPNLILICGNKTANLVDVSTDRNFITEILWRIPGTVEGTVNSNARNLPVTFPEYGTYPSQLIANPGLVCSDTVDFNILLAPPTQLDLDFAYDTCVIAPVQFTSMASKTPDSIASYRWDFGDGETSDEPNPTHLYQFGGRRKVVHTVNDLFGCTTETTRFLDYFPVPPSLNVNVDFDNTCAPATIRFRQASGVITDDYDILWDFGNGETSTELEPNYQYPEPGTFAIYVRALSPAGCFIDTQLVAPLRILESPTAGFTFAPTEIDIREPEVFFRDASQLAVSWQWEFDSLGMSRELNPSYVFPDSGNYEIKLIVSHINGCLDSTLGRLRVNPFQTLFFPNAFTPNDDGKNEAFFPVGFTRYVTDFEMKIFNRWGEQIFITNDLNAGWDGINQRNGLRSSAGVYLYLVTYGGLQGPQRTEGYVTLVE